MTCDLSTSAEWPDNLIIDLGIEKGQHYTVEETENVNGRYPPLAA